MELLEGVVGLGNEHFMEVVKAKNECENGEDFFVYLFVLLGEGCHIDELEGELILNLDHFV